MRAWAVVENEAPLQEMELPTPEPQGTEILLETLYCGVCHSDIHIWGGALRSGWRPGDEPEGPWPDVAIGDGP